MKVFTDHGDETNLAEKDLGTSEGSDDTQKSAVASQVSFRIH